MNPKYIPLFLLFLFPSICLAQFNPVSVSTDVTPEGLYSLNVQNSAPIPYYIIIYLIDTENVDVSVSLPYIGTIWPNTSINRLFTISRKDANKSMSFKTRYYYTEGNPRAKHNNKINYLIPLKDIGATRVTKVNNFAESLGHEVADTWNCFSFIASPGDTVYAARRGVVLEVKDNFEIADQSPYFTIKRNSVKMVHKDGTMSRYLLFQQNGIFVQPGDEVYAGDPIGLVGGTSNQSVGNIWLMIYHYNSGYFKLNGDFNNISMSSFDRMTDEDDPNKWVYVNPNFITTEGIVQLDENGIYESVYTTEGKQQELTKREKKRLLKKNEH